MTASSQPLGTVILLLTVLMLTGCGSTSPTPTPSAQLSAAPSAAPSPTQPPATSPPSSQTSAPTATVSPTPTPTPTPTIPLPTDAAGRLLAHIPAALRPTCTASSSQHALAVAECSPQQGGLTVRYTLYSDTASMEAEYATIAAQAQIEPDTGSCFLVQADGTVSATPDSWPSEQQYRVDGLPAGRYVCLVLANQPTIAWSDGRLDILGQASATSGDYDQLVTFWLRDSGPNR
jgi:hypothetical protein